MAEILNSKRKLCTVEYNGPIIELGGITGPILFPCQLALRSVINMVQHGKKVYEVNPKNRTEKVLLTIQNVQKNNFPTPDKYIMPEERKELEKPAVATKENTIDVSQENLSVNPTEDKLDSVVKSDEGVTSEKVNVSYDKHGKNKNRNSDFSKR